MTIPIDAQETELAFDGILQLENLVQREGPPGLHTFTLAPLPGGASVGPFASIARFRLDERVFPPHPHAGFSAITYVLEHSPTPMRNRDSLGDRSAILGGGSHWTIANSGMLHEETPLQDGLSVEGFQIFLNHPRDRKLDPPASAHFDPQALPKFALAPGVTAKVIIGTLDNASANTPAITEARLLQIDALPGARFRVPGEDDWHNGLFVERGALSFALPTSHYDLPESGYVVWQPPLELEFVVAEALQCFVFQGPEIGEPMVAGGPFIMGSEAELADAFRRFRTGAMGTLHPRGIE